MSTEFKESNGFNEYNVVNYDSTDKLIEDIYNFKDTKQFDGNVVELLLCYCEENNYKIEELGDLLSDNENYKRTITQGLIQGNYIKTEEAQIEDVW